MNALQETLRLTSPFDTIKHVDADGNYWLARELGEKMTYADWRNMEAVLERAKAACRNSGHDPADHFVDVTKMVNIGSGTQRGIPDIRLTRDACYLVAMNCDPRKPEVGLAQAYFKNATMWAESAIAAGPTSEIDLLVNQSLMLHKAAVQLAEQKRRVDHLEIRVDQIDGEVDQLENRVDQIDEDRREAHRQMASLPAPSVPAPARTNRHNINEHIRGFCKTTGADFENCFVKLYREVRYRLGIDVYARQKNNSQKYKNKMDVLDAADVLNEVYALTKELFRWEPKISK